jgi:hypothetical protein
MAEDDAERPPAEDDAERPPVRPKKERGGRRDLYRHYTCEAAREIGILIMVFSALDFTFEYSKASMRDLGGWMAAGAIALAVGIFAAKEVK